MNGVVVAAALSFPDTGSFSTYSYTAPLTVTLNPGTTNIIRSTTIGSEGANIDHMVLFRVKSFTNWAADNGLGDAHSGHSDDEGLVNLLEYAFGGNPLANDAASVLPIAYLLEDNGTPYFYFEHTQRTDDPALVYTIMTQTDLGGASGWTPADVTYVSETEAVDAIKAVTHRVPQDGPVRFFKLQVDELE